MFFRMEHLIGALNNFGAGISYDEKQGKVYLHYTARDKRTKRLSRMQEDFDGESVQRFGTVVASETRPSLMLFAARDEKGKL